MIVGEKFAYIHLQKTAGTYISREFLRCFPESKSMGKKHSGIEELDKKQIQLFLMGSIRHPIDFYVSLWKYGCEGKGGLFHRLVTSKSNISTVIKHVKSNSWGFLKSKHIIKKRYPWKEYYSDSKNVENFQKWYSAIHNINSNLDLGAILGEDFELEFYTKRYLKQYYPPFKTLLIERKSNLSNLILASELNSPNDFKFEVKAERMDNYFIRQEYLFQDLNEMFEILRKLGEREAVEFEFQTEKLNQTEHSNLRYSDYYTSELLNQVLTKDKIIIDQHYSK